MVVSQIRWCRLYDTFCNTNSVAKCLFLCYDWFRNKKKGFMDQIANLPSIQEIANKNKNSSTPVSLRMNTVTYDFFMQAASDHSTSFSVVVNGILDAYVSNYQSTKNIRNVSDKIERIIHILRILAERLDTSKAYSELISLEDQGEINHEFLAGDSKAADSKSCFIITLNQNYVMAPLYPEKIDYFHVTFKSPKHADLIDLRENLNNKALPNFKFADFVLTVPANKYQISEAIFSELRKTFQLFFGYKYEYLTVNEHIDELLELFNKRRKDEIDGLASDLVDMLSADLHEQFQV